MSRKGSNIEEFLREKLLGLESSPPGDWAVFERKLERAILLYRLKWGALISGILILLSLGIWSGQWLNLPMAMQDLPRQYYQPRPAGQTDGPSTGNPATVTNLTALTAIPGASEQNRSPFKTGDADSQTRTVKTQGAQNRLQAVHHGRAQEGHAQPVQGGQPQYHSKQNPGIKPLPERSAADKTARHQPEYIIPGLADKSLRARALPVALLVANTDETAAEGDTENPDGYMLKAITTELHIRPPVMPVNLQPNHEPHISPMQEKNPWSLSLSVIPNFNFQKFKADPDKSQYLHRDFVDATQDAERSGFSLNVGLRVSKRIGPITYLNSGIEYINYKTQVQFDFTHFREALFDPVSEEIQSYKLKNEPEHINFFDQNFYHYINIPLSISHQPWATDHIRLHIEAGGSYMYFVNARGRSLNYRTLEVIDISERDFRPSIGAFHFKVGASYYLSPKFNFGFEPTLMYFTNTIYPDTYPFEVIPYSVGMNLKLQMKLN